MSDEQLYEIARRRIHARNRRWSLWALDLGVLILALAGMILLGSELTVGVFFAWVAIFVVHTIILGFRESSESSIENEVAKLRKATAADLEYEKPKRTSNRDSRRLELSDDGELSEIMDDPHEAQRVKRN